MRLPRWPSSVGQLALRVSSSVCRGLLSMVISASMEHGWPGNRLWSNDGSSKAHESVSWFEEIEMPRRLPPFAPLVAFNAVTRHGSVHRHTAGLGGPQRDLAHKIQK